MGFIALELERDWASRVSSSTLCLNSSHRGDSIPLFQITGLIKYPVPCRVFLLLFKKNFFSSWLSSRSRGFNCSKYV